MKSFFFLLISTLLLLSSCTQINKEDISGVWVINKATFNGTPVEMASKTIRRYVPTFLKNKFTLIFLSNSTVDFPGINTKDVPCKWLIKNDKLYISFDTLRFKNEALSQIDSLGTQIMLNHDPSLKKRYLFKRDSILKITNIAVFKNPISIYTGIYNIDKTEDRLIIKSTTTQIELIDLLIAFKKAIKHVH